MALRHKAGSVLWTGTVLRSTRGQRTDRLGVLIINLNDNNELPVINKYHSPPHGFLFTFWTGGGFFWFMWCEQRGVLFACQILYHFGKSLECLQWSWFVGHFINDPASPIRGTIGPIQWQGALYCKIHIQGKFRNLNSSPNHDAFRLNFHRI